jgi:hypothetical protein
LLAMVYLLEQVCLDDSGDKRRVIYRDEIRDWSEVDGTLGYDR